jgi:hypothetical protein
VVLFGLMVIVHWLGARPSAHPRSKRLVDRFGPIEGSLLGLLVLLLAFTFSIAGVAFEARREVSCFTLKARDTRPRMATYGSAENTIAMTRVSREYIQFRSISWNAVSST